MSTAVELDRTRLGAARLWAADQLPYFSAGLFALVPVAAPGLGTFAVDRRWHLYIDPEVLDRWTVPEAGSVLVHELYHVLREHAERGFELAVGPERAGTWNIACDAEINDDLVALGLPLPDPVLPSTIGCPPDQLAETYYAALPATGLPHLDCGSGAHGQPRDWERIAGGVDHGDAVLVRRQVANDIRDAEASTVPRGLQRWADAQLEQRVDWRRALAAEVRRAVHLVAGRVDYTYRRPARRSSALPGIALPSFARPVPAVAVVVDTSGSMDSEDLGRCLTELDVIISRVGLRSTGVAVLACDAAVHAVRRVSSASRAVLRGGGGTDMGAGIAAAARLRPRPEVVIVLTDGFTPWPVAPPRGVHVVVALLGNRHAGHHTVPGWVRTVVVDR